MGSTNLKTGTYFGLFAALAVSAYLIDGVGQVIFTSLSIICLAITMLFITSQKSKKQWLSAIVNRVNDIKMWHLPVFFGFIGLGITSIQHQQVEIGIASIYLGYIILGWVTGSVLGEQVLRPLFNKLNIFQPSVEIPKEFKDKGWGL